MDKANLDYIVQAASSLEVGLANYYSRLSELYLAFTNSQHKHSKIQFLADMRDTADVFAGAIERILKEKNIPLPLVKNYSILMRDTLHNRYLNMTQLYQKFVFAPSRDMKLQMLTGLYYCLQDIAALAMTTSAEPEPKLELIGE